MAVTVNVTAPSGSNVTIPTTGSVSFGIPSGVSITAVSKQIDSGPLVPIWPGLGDQPPCPNPLSFPVTTVDCPNTNTTYDLTIWVVDSVPDTSSGGTTFTRNGV